MKKVSFIFIFILCLCFSSVFAGENLTINEFKEILKNNNITVPEDVTFPSTFNDLLNVNPIIFLSYDKSEITVVNGNNGRSEVNYVLGIEGTGISMELVFGYCKYDKSYNGSYVGTNNLTPYSCNYFYKINLSDFSFKKYDFTYYGYISGSYKTGYTNKCYLGYLYSQVSDNYSYDDFKSLNNIKNFLETNMLFCGVDNLYYNGSDVNYRFDGVYVGQGDNITGTTMWSNDDVGFSYKNTYPENITWFYLQDVPLSEITEWTANDFNTLNSKYNSDYYIKSINGVNFNYWNDVDSYEVTYQNLAKKLEQGHIYRLYAQTNVTSGDEVIEKYYATTCFFSLNSWKSSAVKVLDISKYLSTDVNDDITLIPGGTTGETTGSTTLDDLNNNINNSINDLNNNIENTILGTENDSGEREGGLVGNLLEGIKNFFIPSDEFFSDYFEELNNWFSDRLGLLYFPIDFIINFLNRIYSSEFSDVVFNIPEIYIPLFEDAEPIIPAYEFNLNEFTNSNENLSTIYNMYLLVVDGIIIWGLISLLTKKYEEVQK